MTEDKAAAYTTLYTVLVTLAKLTAPFTPFLAEQIYQNLVPAFYADAPKSVHMCAFPACDEAAIDADLEKGMDSVLDIVVLGRAARNAGSLKNRQPLSEMVVAAERDLDLNDELRGVILDELNIKQMRSPTDASALVTYKLKPQMKTLGPKYGKLLGAIRAYLETCDGAAVVAAVKDGGTFSAEIGGARRRADGGRPAHLHRERRGLRLRERQGHHRRAQHGAHARAHRRGHRARARLQDPDHAQGGGLRSDRPHPRLLSSRATRSPSAGRPRPPRSPASCSPTSHRLRHRRRVQRRIGTIGGDKGDARRRPQQRSLSGREDV